MQDGKGALYFVKPQATQQTREQMREDSPSGYVSMQNEMDWHGKYLLLLLAIFVIGLIASYAFI